jgi:hypothetical protein
LYLLMAANGELELREFDSWLEDELGKGYVSFSAALLPAGAAYRAGRQAPGRRGFMAGWAARTVAVVGAVSFGLMATGGLAAAVVTGSVDPQVWGRHVVAAVATCKSQLSSGQHGIGACVSAIARQKGAQVRDQHSNGHGAGTTRPSPGGPPSSIATGRPTDVPSGPPNGHPTGGPSGPPNGHPTGGPNGPPTERPAGVPGGPPSGRQTGRP